MTKSKRANRIGELVWNNGTQSNVYYYTHRTNCNSNFTVNISQDKHIKYSKGIPNNSKGSRRHQYYTIMLVSFFSQYLLIVLTSYKMRQKLPKHVPLSKQMLGDYHQKRNGKLNLQYPPREFKNQTSKYNVKWDWDTMYIFILEPWKWRTHLIINQIGLTC